MADYAEQNKREHGLKKRVNRIPQFRLSNEELDMWNEVVLELSKRNITTKADAFVWMVQRCHHQLDEVKIKKIYGRNRKTSK